MAYLAIGAVAAVLVPLAPRSPAQDLAFLLVAAATPVAMLLGVRRYRPAEPAAWRLMAAGLACWVAGGALMSLAHWTSWSPAIAPDLIRLALYPLVTAGILLLIRSRDGARRLETVLDTAIVTTATLMITVVFVVGPAWATGTGPERPLDAAFPLANVLIFGALVRLAFARGPGRLSSIAIAAALGAMLFYQAAAEVVPALPPVASRADALPVEWLIALVLTGAAALHPSMRGLSAPAPQRTERTHSRQIAIPGLALAAGPAVIAVQFLAGVPYSAGVVAVFYVPLLTMVYLRMLALVRRVNDQAITDPLTGLPNRRALHRASRDRLSDPAEPQAFLMLDLDRFKDVNDSLGHQAGDELLVQVAERLRSRLRSDDLLVRLGGDEFAVLLEGAGAAEAEALAATLGAALDEPFDLGELSVHTAASIGISLYPDHGGDLSTLMRKADVAMYRAKSSGGFRVHQDGDDSAARLRLSEEFRTALAEDQLLLHFQPKIDLATGHVRGVEALVRWQHPLRGLLLPISFLPVVESCGLMGPMTRTVLEKAMDQASLWHAAGHELTVAVNISGSSLVDADLPAEVAAVLAARGLPASALQIEITEDVLMMDRIRARAALTALRETGVTIAVDDFGTGYSSLAYLRDLPIDELKLDRTFVSPMTGDALAAALVSSTIDLAHSLGLRMVAEGVEDASAYDELARLGCDQAQGFFMSRPQPAEDLDLALLDGLAPL